MIVSLSSATLHHPKLCLLVTRSPCHQTVQTAQVSVGTCHPPSRCQSRPFITTSMIGVIAVFSAPLVASSQLLHRTANMAATVITETEQQPVAQETTKVTAAAAPSAQAERETVPSAVAKLTAAAKRLNLEGLLARVQQYIRKLQKWIWFLLEELCEEFQPWLKWIIFDAALTLVVGQIVQRIEALRPFFEAVGWA